jgi:hypothetical protein
MDEREKRLSESGFGVIPLFRLWELTRSHEAGCGCVICDLRVRKEDEVRQAKRMAKELLDRQREDYRRRERGDD